MAKKIKSSITISLTDFIDFVNKSGGSKMTKVKQVKSRGKYHPASDFYRILRERIIDVHRNENSKNYLDALVGELSDDKKIKNYPASIMGYKKFWGRKTITWFDPPFSHWKLGDLDIKVNPEIGIKYGGIQFVIKLYFNADKITKDKISQILALMESQLRPEVDKEVVFGVLDVRNSRLHENIYGDITMLPLLEGEARSFETIWKAL